MHSSDIDCIMANRWVVLMDRFIPIKKFGKSDKTNTNSSVAYIYIYPKSNKKIGAIKRNEV
jgi:hypothetical protein